MKKKIIFLAFAIGVFINISAQTVNNKNKQILSKGLLTYEYSDVSSKTNYSLVNIISKNKICFGEMKPTYSIQFTRDSLTYFIDFSGDSIKVGGNFPISKQAKLFFEFIRSISKTKLDSIEHENKMLRKMLYIQAIKSQK